MFVPESGLLQNSCTFFHTPSNMAKDMFFYLICAGHFFCSKNYCVKRNNYNSYLLMYVKAGSGTIHYDSKVFTVNENEVVILNCYKPHAYSSNNWETYWIHFDGNVSDKFFNLLYERLGCVISLKNSLIIPQYLSLIIEDLKSEKLANEPRISCYIQQMLTELLLISSFTNDDGIKRNDSTILNAINYIQINYKNKITLEELSSSVNMSPFYFSRLFKKETGYSPYEYIIITRINEAKKLLKNSNLLIKEIAFMIGFNSESNFVTCFKSHTNLSPKEFRETPF